MKSKHLKKDTDNKFKIFLKRILKIIILLIIVLIFINLIQDYINKKTNIGIQEKMNNIKVNPTEGKTEMMLKLEEIQKINSEIVAWINIEETNINYPVLQSTDNEYYMTHDYKKEYSGNGSIYLDKDCDLNLPSTNLLLYGHNNRNGTMFEELMKYKQEDFYKQHPVIKFATNKEDVEYEIISVFLSRVYYKSEKNVFRYYYFINANTEQEFNNYVQSSKKESIYDTGKTAKYGDELLTLSTCSYHTEDGRLAVVARKIK